MSGDAAKVTPPCPKLIIAMSLYQKGERDRAAEVLSQAVRSFDWDQKVDPNRREEFWVAHILRREAESLIQSHPHAEPPPSPASTAPAAHQ